MPYIDPEVIQRARRVDLLDYLRANEPYELVRISGNLYTTKTHDSLKISNGKWMWWSKGIGGVNALDYLVKVKGMSFLEAVECLSGRLLASYTPTPPAPKTEKKELFLPERNKDNRRVWAYLRSRGIEKDVLCHCMDNGLLYESLPYHNAVFVGYDDAGKARYAAYRAANQRRILGDCPGSDKAYSFRIMGRDKDTLHVFEAAIDALSYASLRCFHRENWREDNLLSLGGVAGAKGQSEEKKLPAALKQYLEKEPQTTRIVLHLDNDEPGRLAVRRITEVLGDRYEVIDDPPPKGKDFNDFLCFQKGILIKGREVREGNDER